MIIIIVYPYYNGNVEVSEVVVYFCRHKKK